MFKYLFAKTTIFRQVLLQSISASRPSCVRHRNRSWGIQRLQARLPRFCPRPRVRSFGHMRQCMCMRHLRLDLHGLRHGDDVHHAALGNTKLWSEKLGLWNCFCGTSACRWVSRCSGPTYLRPRVLGLSVVHRHLHLVVHGDSAGRHVWMTIINRRSRAFTPPTGFLPQRPSC